MPIFTPAPQGSKYIREIGGLVLGEEPPYPPLVKSNYSTWRGLVQSGIKYYEKKILSSKILYLIDLEKDGRYVIKDMDLQFGKLENILGELPKIEAVVHKVDLCLDNTINRMSQLLHFSPSSPATKLTGWGISGELAEEFAGTDSPTPNLYDKVRQAFQMQVNEHSDFKPEVVALTSLFAGPFYYRNLVGVLTSGSDYTLIGTTKSGKTAVRVAISIPHPDDLPGMPAGKVYDKLVNELEYLLLPFENLLRYERVPDPKREEILNYPFTRDLGYIPEINKKYSIQLIKHKRLVSDFSFTEESHAEFKKCEKRIQELFEGTGIAETIIKY